MNELNGLINLISSIKHNKPTKFFGYFPDEPVRPQVGGNFNKLQMPDMTGGHLHHDDGNNLYH